MSDEGRSAKTARYIGCTVIIVGFLCAIYGALGISPGETPMQRVLGFFVFLAVPVLFIALLATFAFLIGLFGSSDTEALSGSLLAFLCS